MKEEELITIITATYNRSNVLKLAIQSVVNNSYKNWELLVIGDACTDDSAEIVEAFNDPRITFTNLDENFGEQSGPNNVGLKKARGKYIAFLNHDDLWFPDHLERSVLTIMQEKADMVFSHAFSKIDRERIEILGGSEDQKYHPHMGVPASLWLLRREMYEELGGWRSWDETYNAPSQDWIYRAWKKGKRIVAAPDISVIIIPSGLREKSYSKRDGDEHVTEFNNMQSDSTYRENLLDRYAQQKSAEYNSNKIWAAFRKLLRVVFFRMAGLFRVNPYAMLLFLKYRKKRGFIRHLRKIRGLSDQPARKKDD